MRIRRIASSAARGAGSSRAASRGGGLVTDLHRRDSRAGRRRPGAPLVLVLVVGRGFGGPGGAGGRRRVHGPGRPGGVGAAVVCRGGLAPAWGRGGGRGGRRGGSDA